MDQPDYLPENVVRWGQIPTGEIVCHYKTEGDRIITGVWRDGVRLGQSESDAVRADYAAKVQAANLAQAQPKELVQEQPEPKPDPEPATKQPKGKRQKKNTFAKRIGLFNAFMDRAGALESADVHIWVLHWRRAHYDGHSSIPITTLKALTRLSQTTIVRCHTRLCAAGWMQRLRKGGPNMGASRYLLKLPETPNITGDEWGAMMIYHRYNGEEIHGTKKYNIKPL